MEQKGERRTVREDAIASDDRQEREEGRERADDETEREKRKPEIKNGGGCVEVKIRDKRERERERVCFNDEKSISQRQNKVAINVGDDIDST